MLDWRPRKDWRSKGWSWEAQAAENNICWTKSVPESWSATRAAHFRSAVLWSGGVMGQATICRCNVWGERRDNHSSSGGPTSHGDTIHLKVRIKVWNHNTCLKWTNTSRIWQVLYTIEIIYIFMERIKKIDPTSTLKKWPCWEKASIQANISLIIVLLSK